MKDWNVVATVADDRFRSAFRLLEPLGRVRRSRYYNVLLMQVEDVREFLERLYQELSEFPERREAVTRISPVTERFPFESVEEFQNEACEAAKGYLDALAGKRFYVRMTRRGWAGRMSTYEQERRLGEFLFESLRERGTPASVSFADPDAIVAVETVDTQAGLALWTREDLQRFSVLRFD